MSAIYFFLVILGAVVLAGCASNVAPQQVQFGRHALLTGDPAAALGHFQQAAQADPNYIADSLPLRQGVWTYVGKTQYRLGQFAEARNSLTESLKRNSHDFMARLYLGLTLLRLPWSPPPTNAFSLSDITFALNERVSPVRIAALVKDRGVDFGLTVEIERELRKLGANDELIEQLRVSAAARKVPEPDPKARGLLETEQALKALRQWLDEVSQTQAGRFWDPTKSIRSEAAKTLKLLASKKPNLGQIVSSGEWIGQSMEEEIDLVRRDEREQLRPRR